MPLPGNRYSDAIESIETDASGWVAYNPGAPTLSSSTDQAFMGSRSLKMVCTSGPNFGGALVGGAVACVAGEKLISSFRFWPVQSMPVWCQVEFLNAGLGSLSFAVGTGFTPPTGQWTEIASVQTAPASAVWVRAGVTANFGATNDTAYLDRMFTGTWVPQKSNVVTRQSVNRAALY